MAEASELGGYEVVGRLAVGGMAEVYQARAKTTTQRSPGEPEEVVLKRLHPSFRADASYVKSFVDEAKLTVRLRHPNIVRTFRLFKAGQDYLMVQELVSGRTLGFMQGLLRQGGHVHAARGVLLHRLVRAQGAGLHPPREGGGERGEHHPPGREPQQHPAERARAT